MTQSHQSMKTIFVVFFLCTVAEYIDFLFLRTDSTIFGDNFVCKLFGVGVLAYFINKLSYHWKDIGFDRSKIPQLMLGLLLGLLTFIIPYAAEYFILTKQGLSPIFEVYVDGFSLTGNIMKNTAPIFFIFCILFNILNVIMEEGIFRGLLVNLSLDRFSPISASLFVAALFGIWHFVIPIRSYIDKEMNFPTMILLCIGYVVLAGLMSIKWTMLRYMTGSLWIGMGDHFFNNTVGNLLHIVTGNEADSMQIVRILIAQIISFIVVFIMFTKHIRSNNI